MNILLLIDKNDIKRKFLNKGLVQRVAEQFVLKKHNVSIFTSDEEAKVKIDKKYLLDVLSLSEALDIIRKKDDDFVLITKLGLSNIDFDKLFIYHKGHNEDCTLVCRNLVKGKTTPVYKLNSEKYITGVNKKRYASCGIYIFKSSVKFSNLKSLSSLVNHLINSNKIKGFIHAGYYSDDEFKIKGIEHKFKRREYLGGKDFSKRG